MFLSPTVSRLYGSVKYAPLLNITAPSESYVKPNFVYKPSWQQQTSNKVNSKGTNKKSRSNNKSNHDSSDNNNNAEKVSTAIGSDKAEETDAKGKSKLGTKNGKNSEKKSSKNHSPDNKSSKAKGDDISKTKIKTEPIDEVSGLVDTSTPYVHSDDNSNDSNHSVNVVFNNSYMTAMKVETDDGTAGNESESAGSKTAASKSSQASSNPDSIKSEATGGGDTMIKQEQFDSEASNNLNKSNNSTDDFETEKVAKIVTVNISHRYENEDFNRECSVRAFNKYKRNSHGHNVQIQYDHLTGQYTYESIVNDPSANEGQQSGDGYDDNEGEDPGATEADDSDNSSCAESVVSAYSPSILPPLPAYRSSASSPTTSASSCCNQNYENIAQPVRLPETNALILNLLLYDTSLNVFKDHNFDSCSLCVCTSSQGHFGNIRGSETGMYLPMRGTHFRVLQSHPNHLIPDYSLPEKPMPHQVNNHYF